MSFTNPEFHIDRISVAGEEAVFVKMFDPRPVGAAPVLPERIDVTVLPITLGANPRANPVPEVMAALGLGVAPGRPHTLDMDLLNGLALPTWDGAKILNFMTIRDKNFAAGGTYPGPIIRIPRGVIVHADLSGKGPPPHTIHWHGIEPTPINDGVGHCSMEIGKYTYQWQPNFIGSYFYHCHRNTVQHFEFGLFGQLLIEPPDAYFASIGAINPDGTVTLNSIPVGACLDGRFRTAANLLTLPANIQAKFPGFVAGDPVFGVAGPNDVGVGHPHAYTVPYDVEALWVPDDRDSRWSDLASDAFATFPASGNTPGVDDDFRANPGIQNFFAFNDYRADYWFISGLPVPTPPGGTGTIPPGIVVPPAGNSGRSGSQVSVNARVGQTILLRCLDAAYNNIRVTLPVDAVIIAWDGRALGVPPFGRYNHPYVVPANTPMTFSVTRRFDALIKAETTMNTFAKVEFMDTRGNAVTATALIPFQISP
jgi:hypothetical protein